MHQIAAKAAIIPAALMLTFLFVGKIDHLDNRLIKEAWQTGHFFLFACLFYILAQLSWAKKQKVIHLFVYVILASWFLGLVTEFVQYFIGRSFQLSDLYRDILGAIAGFVASQLSFQSSREKNALLLLLFLFLTALGLKQLLIVTYDNAQVNKNAPVLSDFETPFELTRWLEMGTDIEISKDYFRNGNHALKISFHPGKHPYATLREMQHDWRGYEHLHFSMYNPHTHDAKMLLKVHDNESQRDARNNRPFYQRVVLKPGWNDVSIDTLDIKTNRAHRQLEMNRIYSLSFIQPQTEQVRVFYVDNIYLSN